LISAQNEGIIHESAVGVCWIPQLKHEEGYLMPLETIQPVQPLHRRFWQWIRSQIVQEVPESQALCEFDCQKLECSQEEWANCERRLQGAAGELRPESSSIRSEAKPTATRSHP